MPSREDQSIVEQTRLRLAERWEAIREASGPAETPPDVPKEVVEAIARCIHSTTKSYRYVLPTQLLAKSVAPALDCRSIQEGSPLPGSFDARTICHHVVVPFDRANHGVLGASAEPYVNHPLRIPSITREFRSARKDKKGFDDLLLVLEFAQENASTVDWLLDEVLRQIMQRLATVRIAYPVPNRVSLDQSATTIKAYLAARTGGVRLQGVSLGLFRSLGEHMNLFASVQSENVNAPDASTGKVADLNCLSEDGNVVIAVEVKDRRLTLTHVQDKLPSVREKAIRELLFLVEGGVDPADCSNVHDVITREFVTGQNVYVCEFTTFLETCLVILGEAARRQFLLNVGTALDEINADLPHREAWRDHLRRL